MPGLVELILDDQIRHFAGQAPGQADQALVVLIQEFPLSMRGL